jgi:DNA-binding LacI/PurR family transcriptional regulator
MSDRPTLRDVARRANVSPQTVSNALNGTGRLSPATRERVLAVVAELGYRSHGAAASLRSGRVNRIVYPLPAGESRDANTLLLEFLDHLVLAADRRRRQVLLVRPDRDEVQALDEALATRSADAVILSAVASGDRRVAHLSKLAIPFACFGRTDRGLPQAWVDVDNRGGVQDVTCALLAAGHRRIAFVGYDPSRRWNAEREAGYRSAMRAAGLRPRVVPARSGAGEVLMRLLDGRSRPTAVVTGSDVLAAECYRAAFRAGLQIGADLSVTGFDGTAVSRLLVPSLTTVAIPLEQIADRLVGRLTGEAANDEGEVLSPRVVVGDSTGPLPLEGASQPVNQANP